MVHSVSGWPATPDAGDVEPGTEGCRKVRWGLNGRGKRGGVRVIYFNQREDGELWLLNIYAKNERAALPKNEVKAQKRRAKKTTRRPPTRERDRRPCHDSAQSS